MSEQKLEPKDYEVWYVQLSDSSIEPAVAWIPTNPENTVWYAGGDSFCADPIAPVASYELVRELVDALETVQTHLYFRAEHIGSCTGDKNCSCGLENAKSEVVIVLAKAKLAGLGA